MKAIEIEESNPWIAKLSSRQKHRVITLIMRREYLDIKLEAWKAQPPISEKDKSYVKFLKNEVKAISFALSSIKYLYLYKQGLLENGKGKGEEDGSN